MPKCSFCQKVYEFPYGLTLALNDGTILHFCSSKCRKNRKMGRKSKKVNWVRKMKHTQDEIITEIKKEAKEKVSESKRTGLASEKEAKKEEVKEEKQQEEGKGKKTEEKKAEKAEETDKKEEEK